MNDSSGLVGDILVWGLCFWLSVTLFKIDYPKTEITVPGAVVMAVLAPHAAVLFGVIAIWDWKKRAFNCQEQK